MLLRPYASPSFRIDVTTPCHIDGASVMFKNPGPATATLIEPRLAAELRRQFVRNLPRLGARRLGQHHGDVARHLAVRGILRRLDIDVADDKIRRQIAPGLHGRERQPDALLDMREYVHCGSSTGIGASATPLAERPD